MNGILLGIHGKIESGKDYSAALIQKLASEEYDSDFIIDGWASSLRDLLFRLTGIPPETSSDRGEKERCVDPDAIEIPDDPVKTLYQFYHDNHYWPSCPVDTTAAAAKMFCDFLRGRPTLGRALQYLGTDVMRNTIDGDIWVSILIARWRGRGRPNTIVADCRFPNEVEALEREGGYVFRIKRRDAVSHNRDPKHPSEVALDSHPLMTVINPMDCRLAERLRPILAQLLNEAFKKTPI